MPTKKRIQPGQLGEESFAISLTKQQREAMIHCTRLKAAIRRKIAETDEGTQVITFTKKELDHMEVEIATSAIYAPSPYKKHLVAAQKKVAEMVQECQPVSGQRSTHRPRPAAKSDLLFQFKITLLDIQPSIWRRFQVQDCKLAELHNHIQAAFGWWNYHLHMFEIDGLRYGPPPEDDFDLDMEDDSRVRLSQLLPKSSKRTRWMYEYDFGDGWRHEVLFEGYPPLDPKAKYPLCLEGERACPPEDCGGPFGFAEYLAAMANPRSKRHQELMEWRGPFDPLAFDPKKATRKMRKSLPLGTK